MNEIKETGGARIGMANATWPFATLTVNKDVLQLNATILGKFIFKPGDIVSIERYPAFLGEGIRINHNVARYNRKIIFWTSGSANALIERIRQTGFLDNKNFTTSTFDDSIIASQAQGGFPLKIPAAIAIVVIWNILFFADSKDFFERSKNSSPLGTGSQLGLGFIVVICILLLTSEPVRRLILKEGRNIDDIKRFVYFAMFICGFILLMSIVVR